MGGFKIYWKPVCKLDINYENCKPHDYCIGKCQEYVCTEHIQRLVVHMLDKVGKSKNNEWSQSSHY